MKDFYPTSEIARRLGVSGNSVRLMCQRGDLPHIKLKVGVRYRYFVPVQEFDQILSDAFRPAKPGRPNWVKIVKGRE